ncbi:MAG: conjugal transfer protein TraR [Ignavibacteriaceae bacterium]|nr:conjugal transfer protein TraR [Ignavibacteriaceae bacterium]
MAKKTVKKVSAKKTVVKKTKTAKTVSRLKVKKGAKLAPKKIKVVKKVKPPVKKVVKKKEIVKKPVVRKMKKKTEVEQFELEPIKKSVAHIKGYSKKELEEFRTIILEKRDEILEQLQNLKDQMLDPSTGEYINENSPYSLHMAEQGTDAMEREKTFLYAQRENKFLGYLEDALKRIDAGTYGICLECIDEPQHLCETCPLIPKERLRAVPHSQLCLPMKQRQEKK